VLGAPEALAPALAGEDLTAAVRARTAQGLRVLVFARAADPSAPLREPGDGPVLPPLQPLALVALADELRADVPDTIARMGAEGSR
jgi:cation-transporting P-type ATPase E